MLEPRVLVMLHGQEMQHGSNAPPCTYGPFATKIRLAKWMVATTKFIWDKKNGRTEAKNTWEAIKCKLTQKNDSIAAVEKVVVEEDLGLAREEDEKERRRDRSHERSSADTDPETLGHNEQPRNRSRSRSERRQHRKRWAGFVLDAREERNKECMDRCPLGDSSTWSQRLKGNASGCLLRDDCTGSQQLKSEQEMVRQPFRNKKTGWAKPPQKMKSSHHLGDLLDNVPLSPPWLLYGSRNAHRRVTRRKRSRSRSVPVASK